jgi:hypothetical protein
VFPDPHLLVMLAQELASNRIAIFCDDPHQAIDVFGMVANELGEFLHLGFEPLQPP